MEGEERDMSEDDTYSRRGTEVDRYTIVERD